MKNRKIIYVIAGVVLSVIIMLCAVPLAAYFLPANILPGYAGTIEIADVGIEVPLIEIPADEKVNDTEAFFIGELCQFLIDKDDCAAKFYRDPGGVVIENKPTGSWLIGDHSTQGFASLKECREGMEVVISKPDGSVEAYYVAKFFMGYNIKTHLVNEDGISILNDNPGGIILYTCADETSIPVYIAFLQPV